MAAKLSLALRWTCTAGHEVFRTYEMSELYRFFDQGRATALCRQCGHAQSLDQKAVSEVREWLVRNDRRRTPREPT